MSRGENVSAQRLVKGKTRESWRPACFLQAKGVWPKWVLKVKRTIYPHVRNNTEGIRALKQLGAWAHSCPGDRIWVPELFISLPSLQLPCGDGAVLPWRGDRGSARSPGEVSSCPGTSDVHTSRSNPPVPGLHPSLRVHHRGCEQTHGTISAFAMSWWSVFSYGCVLPFCPSLCSSSHAVHAFTLWGLFRTSHLFLLLTPQWEPVQLLPGQDGEQGAQLVLARLMK